MTKLIYLAGGCFWGTQHFLKQIRGIISTEVGYANGNTENPTYKARLFVTARLCSTA